MIHVLVKTKPISRIYVIYVSRIGFLEFYPLFTTKKPPGQFRAAEMFDYYRLTIRLAIIIGITRCGLPVTNT